MQWYRADLHIHSVLSPCGGLEMSPSVVAKCAQEKGIDVIAITDHNSTLNLPAYEDVLKKAGITLIPGIEIQTAEELHLIALFDSIASASNFGAELYESLLPIENDPDFFGDQVVIDSDENILRMESKALINSSVWSLEETCRKLSSYQSIYYPAHVDAASFSIIGQLGFIPLDLHFKAVEITAKGNIDKILDLYPYIKEYQIIRSSDSHYSKDIGSGVTEFYMKAASFFEIKNTLNLKNGRKIRA